MIKYCFKVSRFSTLALFTKNPYQNLPKQQIYTHYLRNQNPQSLNTLILIGSVMKKHKMKELTNLLQLTKKIIKSQIHQNRQNPQKILYSEWLILYNNEIPKQILKIYINCYYHILDNILQHLEVYQILTNLSTIDQQISLAIDLSRDKIIRYFQKQQEYSLYQYIHYVRLFPHVLQDAPQRFIRQVQIKKNEIKELNNLCKTILHYIISAKLNMISQAKQLGLKTPQITYKETQKQFCMKLQLLKLESHNLSKYMNQVCFENWNYNNIIWVSQYLIGAAPATYQKLHQAFIKSKLGNIVLLADYFQNQKKQYFKESQLWLLKQNLEKQCQNSICSLLEYLDKQYFKQFLKKVTQICLGNYQWENLNKIYYYGILWKTNDPNLQYVRRYILNGYAALGTARRDIPTKITTVQQFYKNNFKIV